MVRGRQVGTRAQAHSRSKFAEGLDEDDERGEFGRFHRSLRDLQPVDRKVCGLGHWQLQLCCNNHK